MMKVAAYCRVSTDREDQANSFESQQRYFEEYIRANPDWELYDIYADEGITGTSTKKRFQFNRMIRDANNGKFSLIVTKEVSRFSRNILDTISYTRQLRSIGVGVFFVTDRIHTMNPEAEMLLSFLASMAQEESRKTSARVTWGQTRQMEKGVVFGPSLLGYHVKEGKITVNRDESGIVQMIFHKYVIEQVGISEIARYLTQNGYSTHSGRSNWNPSAVLKILKNEKYVGDLIQKKTYTPDYLTHEKKANKGDVPKVQQTGHHEPIISRDIWNLAQQRLSRNRKQSDCCCSHSNRYVFSGKIICGECGSSFVSRMKYLTDGTPVRRWSCRMAVSGGTEGCRVGTLIRDDDCFQILKTALEALRIDRAAIALSMANLIQKVKRTDAKEVSRFRQDIQRIEEKRRRMLDSYFAGEISREEMYAFEHRYESQLSSLRIQLSQSETCRQKHENMIDTISSELNGILSGQIISEGVYKAILENLTVYKNGELALKLKHLPHVFRFSYVSL